MTFLRRLFARPQTPPPPPPTPEESADEDGMGPAFIWEYGDLDTGHGSRGTAREADR